MVLCAYTTKHHRENVEQKRWLSRSQHGQLLVSDYLTKHGTYVLRRRNRHGYRVSPFSACGPVPLWIPSWRLSPQLVAQSEGRCLLPLVVVTYYRRVALAFTSCKLEVMPTCREYKIDSWPRQAWRVAIQPDQLPVPANDSLLCMSDRLASPRKKRRPMRSSLNGTKLTLARTTGIWVWHW